METAASTVRLAAAADTAPVSSAPSLGCLDPRTGENPYWFRSSWLNHGPHFPRASDTWPMGERHPRERLALANDQLRLDDRLGRTAS